MNAIIIGTYVVARPDKTRERVIDPIAVRLVIIILFVGAVVVVESGKERKARNPLMSNHCY